MYSNALKEGLIHPEKGAVGEVKVKAGLDPLAICKKILARWYMI